MKIYFTYKGSDFEGNVYPISEEYELVHYTVTITNFPPVILEARLGESENLHWIDINTGLQTDLTQALGKAIEQAEM